MFGFRRVATATLVAAGLVVGGAALAHAGSSAAAPLAAAGQNVATGFLANGNGNNNGGTNGNGNGTYGHRGPGGFGGPGAYGGFGYRGRGGLTVTGVNGNTITATGRGGQAITVTVSATTVYTEAGQTASLSDVTPGTNIAVQSTNAGAGSMGTGTNTTTIAATAIYIILPREAGVVTAINGNTLTITGFDGATRTITVTDSTRYQSAGQTAALSNITTGTAIVAEGTTDANGVLTAKVVTIQVPRIGGQVTAVDGSSYTISGRDGTTYTVNTTGSTTYVNPDGSSATTTPTIAKGAFIIAEGTLSADGKTLTAQRILVVPAGANGMGNGFGRHGGRGYSFGGQGFGGQGSGATTSGSTSTSSI